MKPILSLALCVVSCLFCLTTNSQRITVHEYDKFTKQVRVETSYQYLKTGLSCYIRMKLRSVDSSFYVIAQGSSCGAGVINSDDQMIFLLDNDSTVVVTSTGIQSYDVNQYGKSYIHQYEIILPSIEMLAAHSLKSIRKYSSIGYSDIDCPDRNRDALKELCQLFLKELAKPTPKK